MNHDEPVVTPGLGYDQPIKEHHHSLLPQCLLEGSALPQHDHIPHPADSQASTASTFQPMRFHQNQKDPNRIPPTPFFCACHDVIGAWLRIANDSKHFCYSLSSTRLHGASFYRHRLELYQMASLRSKLIHYMPPVITALLLKENKIIQDSFN